MKVLFPDSLWSVSQISGSAFLYSYEEKVGITLHPSVSAFLTGIDPFDFAKFVEKQMPPWIVNFKTFWGLWELHQHNLQITNKIIEPLKGKAFKTIWFIYPRGGSAFNEAQELIESLDINQDELKDIVDPLSAADELFSHIFLEKYLEIYQNDKTPDEIIKMGMAKMREQIEEPNLKKRKPTKIDWRPLYNYCNNLFSSLSLDQIFQTTYMFRVPAIKAYREILLSNERLIKLLNILPIQYQKSSKSDDKELKLNLIAWEFFRQILSSFTDPLDKKKVKFIKRTISKRNSEIENLKNRCLLLAQDFEDENNLNRLQKNIAKHIKQYVQKDIQSILHADKHAFEDFIGSIFADEKTWLAISAFILSILKGGPIITAGAALVGLSNFGAKAVKAAIEKRKTLRSNDYAIIHRMKNI